MWVNVPGSFSPCLLPMWLEFTHLALGVPRKRYSSPVAPHCYFYFTIDSTRCLLTWWWGLGHSLLFLWSLTLGQARSPRGVAFINVPGFPPDGGSLAQLPSFLEGTLLLFFCSLTFAIMGCHQFCPAAGDFCSLEKGRYIGLSRVLAVAAVPSFRQHQREEFSGPSPFPPWDSGGILGEKPASQHELPYVCDSLRWPTCTLACTNQF